MHQGGPTNLLRKRETSAQRDLHPPKEERETSAQSSPHSPKEERGNLCAERPPFLKAPLRTLRWRETSRL